MSSHGSPSLEIEPSRKLQFAVMVTVWIIFITVPFCIHVLSPLAALSIAFVGLAITTLSFWRVGWLGAKRRIVRVRWLTEGTWHLDGVAGHGVTGVLAPGTRLVGPLAWLKFASEVGPRHVLRWRGQADETYRRLSVRLRLEAARHAEAGPDTEI